MKAKAKRSKLKTTKAGKNDAFEEKTHYVRQCAFSDDLAMVIAVDDQARVHQFERIAAPVTIVID